MKITDIISATYAILTKWSRSRLLRTIEILRDGYRELSEKCSDLEAENEKLKEEPEKAENQGREQGCQ